MTTTRRRSTLVMGSWWFLCSLLVLATEVAEGLAASPGITEATVDVSGRSLQAQVDGQASCSVMDTPPCLTIGLLSDDETNAEIFHTAIDEFNSGKDRDTVRFRGVRLRTAGASLPATINAQTLVEKYNAFAVIGAGSSSVSLQVQSYLATQDRLQVAHQSTSPTLSDADASPTFARVMASDEYQVSAMINFLKFYGWDEINIIYGNSVYGIAGHEVLQEQCQEARISVASSTRIQDSSDKSATSGGGGFVLDKDDVRAALIKTRKSQVRIVVLFVTRNEAKALFEVAEDLNMLGSHTVWLVPDAVIGESDKLESWLRAKPTIARSLLRNLIGFHPGAPPESANAAAASSSSSNGDGSSTISIFKEPTGFTFFDIIPQHTVTDLGEAYLRDAVTAVTTVAKQTMQTHGIASVFSARTRLMPALRTLSFEGHTGTVSFKENGDRASGPGYSIFQLNHHFEMNHVANWNVGMEIPQLLGDRDHLEWGVHAVVDIPKTRPEPLDCTTCREREDVRIAIFSHGDFNSGFWNSVKMGMLAAASELRVSKNLNITGIDDKNYTRIKDLFQESLNHYNKPDVIITSQPDTQLLIEQVEMAAAFGVNVITFNTGEDVQFPDGIRPISHVGMNNTRGGENAARTVKEFGAREKVLCINHSPKAEHNVNRCKGVEAGAAAAGLEYGLVEIEVRSEYARYLDDGLREHPLADAMVITSAKFIEETRNVMRKLRRTNMVVGVFDLSEASVAGIEDDDIHFAMRQNEYSQGYLPVVLAMVESTIRIKIKQHMFETGPDVITKENLDYVKCSLSEEEHCLPDPRDPTREKTPVVGVITHARAASSFWPPILAGLKQASIDSVVKLDMTHFYFKDNSTYDGSAESMAGATRDLMNSGVDGMIMSDATQEIVDELNKRQIPFMLINKKPSRLRLDHLPMFMNYIGQDDMQAGKDVLEKSSRGFTPHILVADKGDDHPRILGGREAAIELGGKATVLPLWDILKISSHDSVKQVQVIRDALQADDRVNMIFTAKSDVALMAVQAAQMLDKPIPVVTFDTDPLVVRKITFGEIAMTVDQVPYMQGVLPVMLLSSFFKTHNRVSSEQISTGAYFLTPDTVEQASCANELSSSCSWLICDKGYFFNMSSGTCESCGPGTYQPTSLAVDDASCLSCPVGTFNPYSGMADESDCLPAPNGTFVGVLGAEEPMLCEEGALCGLASTRSNITNRTNFDIYAEEEEVEDDSFHDSYFVLIVSAFVLVLIFILLILVRKVSCINYTMKLMDLYSPMARPKDEDPETYWGGVFTLTLGLATGCYCIFFAVSYFTSYTTTTSLLPGVLALEDYDAELTPKRFDIRMTILGNVGECSDYTVVVESNYDDDEKAVMETLVTKNALDECEILWAIEDLNAEKSEVTFTLDEKLAYASAIAWNVTAPSEIPGEMSMVNGLLLPAEDEVIRGPEASEISLTCYHTLFQDNTEARLTDGVRSQIQVELVGSTVSYDEFHSQQGLSIEFKFMWSSMIIVKERDRYQPIMSFVAEITAMGGWFETILAIVTTAAFLRWIARTRDAAADAARAVTDPVIHTAENIAERAGNLFSDSWATLHSRGSNHSLEKDPKKNKDGMNYHEKDGIKYVEYRAQEQATTQGHDSYSSSNNNPSFEFDHSQNTASKGRSSGHSLRRTSDSNSLHVVDLTRGETEMYDNRTTTRRGYHANHASKDVSV